jgi:hypothetical protein
LGDNVEEYTDSIFFWTVKIVTVDEEMFQPNIMTIKPALVVSQDQQCRDLLSLWIATQITSLRTVWT